MVAPLLDELNPSTPDEMSGLGSHFLHLKVTERVKYNFIIDYIIALFFFAWIFIFRNTANPILYIS